MKNQTKKSIKKPAKKQAKKKVKPSVINPNLVIVVVILLALGLLFYRNNANHKKRLLENVPLVNTCLSDAYGTYKTNWNQADTDGDGKISYADGAKDINVAYYDAQINCYTLYPIENSENLKNVLISQKQTEIDKYNTYISNQEKYLKSLIDIYKSTNRNNVHCTSDLLGGYNCR